MVNLYIAVTLGLLALNKWLVLITREPLCTTTKVLNQQKSGTWHLRNIQREIKICLNNVHASNALESEVVVWL